jgi:hypothetical protein
MHERTRDVDVSTQRAADISGPLTSDMSSIPTAQRDLRCPACRGRMARLNDRLYLCAVCRQSILTFEVIHHQYLDRTRKPQILVPHPTTCGVAP